MKFKVGDTVKVVPKSNLCRYAFSSDTICTVTYVCERDKTYVVRGKENRTNRNIEQFVNERYLELVKDDTQVKHHSPKVYVVYEEMKRHIGEENSISATDLCIACGVSSHRELREIMREMRRSGELEKIPCSCNKGYYMASTKEEAMSAIDRLINTAKNEFKTGYIMMKKLGLDKQMKIPLGEYFKDTYHSLMEIDDETNTKTN